MARDLISPLLGPAAALRCRHAADDEWIEIDQSVGRAQLLFELPRDKRTRPEAGGGYGATPLGWANGRIGFVVDDEHTTRALFYFRSGRRVLFELDPAGPAAGGPRWAGTAMVTCTPTVSATGRILTVVFGQHNTWTESTTP